MDYHARLLQDQDALVTKLENEPEFFSYLNGVVGDEDNIDGRHGKAWEQFLNILNKNDRIVHQIVTGKKKKVKFSKYKHVKKFLKQ